MSGALGDVHSAAGSVKRVAVAHAYEMTQMAAAVAKVPLHLLYSDDDGGEFGSGSSSAQFDEHLTARPPVLLVHGLGGRKSSWSRVASTLAGRGLVVDAIGYAPFGTSIENVADRLVADVKRMLSVTDAEKVSLVGHSLGGVIIAHAIASGRLNGLVDTVVTLGSPFRGSPWASLLPFGDLIPALRQGSPLLRMLAAAPPPDGVRWLAFTAALDVIVPSLRAVPAHAAVETVIVRDVGHLGMLVSQQVAERLADALPA